LNSSYQGRKIKMKLADIDWMKWRDELPTKRHVETNRWKLECPRLLFSLFQTLKFGQWFDHKC
jgi:hypothetical protein